MAHWPTAGCTTCSSRGKAASSRPVNRIDKNTSGLVLCAKTPLPHRCWPGLPTVLPLRLCRVQCRWGPGRVEAPIARRGDSIIGRCVCADGKYSLTEYAVLAAGRATVCWPAGRAPGAPIRFAYTCPISAIRWRGGRCTAGRDILLRRHALHCGILCVCAPADREAPPCGVSAARGYGRPGPAGKAADGLAAAGVCPCGADPT